MWSIPEPAPSAPVSVTVGDAYQPFCAAGVIAAVDVGLFRSTLTVIDFVASMLPAASVEPRTDRVRAARDRRRADVNGPV